SGIAVQIIKNLINSPRPKLFFEHGQYLFFIDNLSLSGYASFPSGHTATAFAIATVSMLILKNKKWNLSFLIAAILVGYSRIYLAQHFLLDVLTGALIGTIAAFPAMYLASNSKGIKNSFNKLRRIDNDMVPSNPGPGIIQTN
ncbi:MAG: phosphatase PAP2 family protein, partial [Ferruginibacter sp.]